MLLVSLLLAHLLGDFLLQPRPWVEDKEKRGAKSPYLYTHIAIHVLLLLLVLPKQVLWIVPVVGISHFLIDLTKIKRQREETKNQWFYWDQLLHLLVLGIVFYLAEGTGAIEIDWEGLLPIVTGGVFVTLPCSILVKNLISGFTPQIPEESKWDKDSLVSAGAYIGMLERLLVYVFIITGHWEGVGFMIAAKSVFRFSDLAQSRQRKLTEYVLIGTLLSFGLATLTGILVVGL